MGVAIGCAYLLVFVANERSGATLVASVQPIMPVSVALMSSALGLEPMGRMKALGVLVTTVGTITALRAYEVFQADGMNFVAAVCLLSQTNSYACYVVMLGLATKRYPYPLLWLFTATLVAEIGITLIGIPTFRSFDARSVPASAWGAVVFAGASIFAIGRDKAARGNYFRPLAPSDFEGCAAADFERYVACLLYTSPSPRDRG